MGIPYFHSWHTFILSLQKGIRTYLILSITSSFFLSCKSQNIELSETDLFSYLSEKDPQVDSVLNNPENYRLQVIYSQIDRNNQGEVSIQTIDMSSGQYMYPASLVKLPSSLLALEKLNHLGIDSEHYIRIKDDFICHNSDYIEQSLTDKISIHDFVREMMVVSNNSAMGAIYDFLTPRYIENGLKSKQLLDTHIYKKFAGCSFTENLNCNPIQIFDHSDDLIYSQDASVYNLAEMASNFIYAEDKLIGEATESGTKTIPRPFDFNYNLQASLSDVHTSLVRLIFPESVPSALRWSISESDRLFLIESMGLFPRELHLEKYDDRKKYPDHLVKYLLFGDDGDSTTLSNTRTVSKIGIAYGFVNECAYIVDLENNIDFFLSVSIYANQNDIVNDGRYEYEDIAMPFLGKLGKLILDYELERAREHPQELREMKAIFH